MDLQQLCLEKGHKLSIVSKLVQHCVAIDVWWIVKIEELEANFGELDDKPSDEYVESEEEKGQDDCTQQFVLP